MAHTTGSIVSVAFIGPLQSWLPSRCQPRHRSLLAAGYGVCAPPQSVVARQSAASVVQETQTGVPRNTCNTLHPQLLCGATTLRTLHKP
jgi:hypothetical protein